jgi:hypothetical protein
MAAFIKEVKGVDRAVHDMTGKPPGHDRVGAAPPWRAARIRRRASAFKGLGAKICNFRGDAYRSDAVMLGRWAYLSALPPAHPRLGIDASEAMPFPGADSIVSSLSGAMSGRFARAGRSARERNARPPRRDGAPPGRAGRRERGRRSEVRPAAFGSIPS